MATPTKTEQQSQHLAAARELLANLENESDAQVQAASAVAQSVLVLAEQVAGVRVLMAAQISHEINGNGASNS
jgi:hypothetical protein